MNQYRTHQNYNKINLFSNLQDLKLNESLISHIFSATKRNYKEKEKEKEREPRRVLKREI